MAVQLATFLSGSINNVVFYKLGHHYVARSKPATVQQTDATKIRSRNFGIASSAGRVLRSLLQAVLPFPKDKTMQRAFTGAIANWLKQSDAAALQPATNLPYIEGFSLNTATSLQETLRVPLQVIQNGGNGLQLLWPAFVPQQKMIAPAGTERISIRMVCAGVCLTNCNRYQQQTATLELPYNNVLLPAQVIDMPVEIAGGQLIVTALSLQYQLANGSVCTKENWMPAGVIDARYC